uniref:peptidylprolyl isomerase n=1 Tax=Heterorhabditis bacteriophora TaxID=37862 RepID=A0A1I7XEU9_HETBA
MRIAFFLLVSLRSIICSSDADVDESSLKKRKVEDSIPVIEIRGEGKPMTAAQIRHLEEMSNGKPLDIKVHGNLQLSYVFTEDGKKVHQSYGGQAPRIQLGVGMAMPGLDKGLKGMCNEELRKIQIPYRLSRKSKSRGIFSIFRSLLELILPYITTVISVWKQIPNDEHWLTFNIEMMSVEPYSHQAQFRFMDINGDNRIVDTELVLWAENMKKEFGKTWSNEDIDNVIVARYYIKYFDVNGDGKVLEDEFVQIMARDENLIKYSETKEKGRKRDPGLAWILDFNNDGITSYKEVDNAPEILQKDPVLLPLLKDEL